MAAEGSMLHVDPLANLCDSSLIYKYSSVFMWLHGHIPINFGVEYVSIYLKYFVQMMHTNISIFF